MSLKKKILMAIAVVAVVAATFLFFAFKKIYTPTTGNRIAGYASPSKALLVIDVQEDFTGITGRQPPLLKNVGAQISTINKIIEKASTSGMQVVYIRQIFSNNYITRRFIGRAI